MKILSRLALVFLVLLGLIALALGGFYAEENARGAREWATAQENLKKLGECYDYNDFIPPQIPDSDNLAALPLFQLTSEAKNSNVKQATALEKALANLAPRDRSFPVIRGWLMDMPGDMDVVKNMSRVAMHTSLVMPPRASDRWSKSMRSVPPFINFKKRP